MRSTSMSASQTCSTGAATVNDCSSFMCAGPPALRGCRRRPGRTGAPASNVLTVGVAEQVAGARRRRAASPTVGQDGTPERDGVARPRRRRWRARPRCRAGARRGVVHDRRDDLRRHARLVAERDDRPSRSRRPPRRRSAARRPCPRPSRAHTTVRAAPKSTAARTRSASAPSTTTTGSIAGTASIASTRAAGAGRPSSSASCLGEPKRDAPPAASTTPPIKR